MDSPDGELLTTSCLEQLMTSFLAAIMTILLSWRYMLDADDSGINDVIISRQQADKLTARNRPQHCGYSALPQGATHIVPRCQVENGKKSTEITVETHKGTCDPGTRELRLTYENSDTLLGSCVGEGTERGTAKCTPALVSPVLSDRAAWRRMVEEDVESDNQWQSSLSSRQLIRSGRTKRPGAQWTGRADRRKQRVEGYTCRGYDGRAVGSVSGETVNKERVKAKTNSPSTEVCLELCPRCTVERECGAAAVICRRANGMDDMTSHSVRDRCDDPGFEADDGTRGYVARAANMEEDNHNKVTKPVIPSAAVTEFSRGKSTGPSSNVHDRIQACSRRTYGISNNIQQKFNHSINKALYQLASYEHAEDEAADCDNSENKTSPYDFKAGAYSTDYGRTMSSGQFTFADFDHDRSPSSSPTAKVPKSDDLGYLNLSYLDDLDTDSGDRSLNAPVDNIAKIGSIEDLLSHEMSFDYDDVEVDNVSADADKFSSSSSSNSNSDSEQEHEAELNEFYDRTLDTITEEDSDDIEQYSPGEDHVTLTSVPWWKVDQAEKYGYDVTDTCSSDSDDKTPCVSPVSTSLKKYSSDSDLSNIAIKPDFHTHISRASDSVPQIKIHSADNVIGHEISPDFAEDFDAFNKSVEAALIKKSDSASKARDSASCARDVPDKTDSQNTETDANEDMSFVDAEAFFEAEVFPEESLYFSQNNPVLEKQEKTAPRPCDKGDKIAADGQIPSDVDSLGQKHRHKNFYGPNENFSVEMEGAVTTNPHYSEQENGTLKDKQSASRMIDAPISPLNTDRSDREIKDTKSCTQSRDSNDTRAPWSVSGYQRGKQGVVQTIDSRARDNAGARQDRGPDIDLVQRTPREKPAQSCSQTTGSARSPHVEYDNNNGVKDAVRYDREISSSALHTGVTSDNDATGTTEKLNDKIPASDCISGNTLLDTAQQPREPAGTEQGTISPGPPAGDCLPNCDNREGQQRDLHGNISRGGTREEYSDSDLKQTYTSPGTGDRGAAPRFTEHKAGSPAASRLQTRAHITLQHDHRTAGAPNEDNSSFVFTIPEEKTDKSYTFTIPKDGAKGGTDRVLPASLKGGVPVDETSAKAKVDLNIFAEDKSQRILHSPVITGQHLMNTNTGSPRTENIGVRASGNRINTATYLPQVTNTAGDSIGYKPVTQNPGDGDIHGRSLPRPGLAGNSINHIKITDYANSKTDNVVKSHQKNYVTTNTHFVENQAPRVIPENTRYSSDTPDDKNSVKYAGFKKHTPDPRSVISAPDLLWNDTSVGTVQTFNSATVDVYKPTATCTAMATSTALARRDSPRHSPRSGEDHSGSVISAVARAEATAENPYIAVARASARAASVATASATSALTDPGDMDTDPEQADINVVISTSCTLKGQDQDLHRDSSDILESLGDMAEVNVHTIGAQKPDLKKSGSRMKALTDASTQSSPDTRRAAVLSPNARRKLKITIEHPEKLDGALKEVRTLECDLPATRKDVDITTVISDAVRQILQNNSKSLPHGFMLSDNFDKTVQKVTEHVIHAYSNKSPVEGDVMPASTSGVNIEEAVVPKPLRKKRKSKKSEGKVTKRKSKTADAPVVFVPTEMEGNSPLTEDVQPSAYSEHYNISYEKQDEPVSSETVPEIQLNNVVINERTTGSSPTPKALKVKKTKKVRSDKPKKPKVKRLQFVEIDTVSVERLLDADQHVTAEIVNIGKGGRVDTDTTSIVHVKEKKKKAKKNGKLKGILKNTNQSGQDAEDADPVSVEIETIINTRDDSADLLDSSNPFKENGELDNEVRATGDKTESNYIGYMYDSQLIKASTIDHEGLPGKHDASTASTQPKSILKKQGTADSAEVLGRRFQPENKEKAPYKSVLQEPVPDVKVAARESDQSPVAQAEPSSDRKRIIHSRKDYLKQATNEKEQQTQENSEGKQVDKINTSAPVKPTPHRLFVVDINIESAPKPDIDELKQKVLSARPKAPSAPYSDSLWNAGHLIAAAKSIDGGLDVLDGDTTITKRYSSRSLPVPSTESPVRKTKSLGTLPAQFASNDLKQSPFVEADLDDVDLKMTPDYFETNLDDSDSERSKSMINLRNQQTVAYDNAMMNQTAEHLVDFCPGALQYVDSDKRSRSESQLRVAQSLSKLSVPDWYKNSPRKEQEIVILKHARPSVHDQVDNERGRTPWKVNRNDVSQDQGGNAGNKPIIIQQSFSYRPSVRGCSPVMQDVRMGNSGHTFELPSAKLRSKSQERLQIFPVKPYEEVVASSVQAQHVSRPAKEAYIEIRERSKSRERMDFRWQVSDIEKEDKAAGLPEESSCVDTTKVELRIKPNVENKLERRKSRSRKPYVESATNDFNVGQPLSVNVQPSRESYTSSGQDTLQSPKDSGLGSSFTSTPHSPAESQIQHDQHTTQYSNYREEPIYENMPCQSREQYIDCGDKSLSRPQITSQVDGQEAEVLARTRRKKAAGNDISTKKSHGKKSRKTSKSKESQTQEALQALLLTDVVDSGPMDTHSRNDIDFVDPPTSNLHTAEMAKQTGRVLQQHALEGNIDIHNTLQFEEAPTVTKKPKKSKGQKKQKNVDRNAPQREITGSDNKGSFENLLDGLLVLDSPPTTLLCNVDENNKIYSSVVDSKLNPLQRALSLLKLKDTEDVQMEAENFTSLYSVHGSPHLEIKPSHTLESGESETTVKCRNTKCGLIATLADARKTYKTCHNCYTYYCSRDCRKAHWERHKKKCHYSRINSACKHVVKKSREDGDVSKEIARAARAGYLSRGRGCVMLVFSSIGSADNFLIHGITALESPPVYAAIADFQDVESLGEHFFDLTEMCKTYNPELKCVLEVAIVAGSADALPSQSPPRREGPVIKKCVKVRLNSDVIQSQENNPDKLDKDTLILTAVPGSEFTENMEERKAREICFVNIQRKLRERGVSLRHHFPDVYSQLCSYVADNLHFTPITLYPVDASTGKKFMCLIMPDAEPDVEWSNRTDLLDQLGLSTTV